MKLCFLTETFYPPTLAGMALHTSQLAQKLAANGADVLVLTRRETIEPLPPHEGIGNVRVLRIPPGEQFRGKGWRALPPMLFFLSGLVARLLVHWRRYDVIVVFGAKVLPAPAVLMRIFGGKKCVVRVESPKELREGVTSESLENMKLHQSANVLQRIFRLQMGFLRRADMVIALSSEIQGRLLDLGVSPRKIAAIPNGIDISSYSPAKNGEKPQLRQKLSLPPGKIIFVYTGRIARSKGVPILAKAWQELAGAYSDIHLVLVGTGAEAHDSCEEEIRSFFDRQGLTESVTFTGSVANVAEYLRAADIFVFPSEWESFGLSIVEAMACALPVVTTKVGVAQDCIRHRQNGLLVEIGDQPGLAREVRWLLEHRDLWAKIGLSGREKVLEMYSLEKEVDQYMALFSRLSGLHRQ